MAAIDEEPLLRDRVGLCGCSWFALRVHVPSPLRLEAATGCALSRLR